MIPEENRFIADALHPIVRDFEALYERIDDRRQEKKPEAAAEGGAA